MFTRIAHAASTDPTILEIDVSCAAQCGLLTRRSLLQRIKAKEIDCIFAAPAKPEQVGSGFSFLIQVVRTLDTSQLRDDVIFAWARPDTGGRPDEKHATKCPGST